jgi:hypothetical protein
MNLNKSSAVIAVLIGIVGCGGSEDVVEASANLSGQNITAYTSSEIDADQTGSANGVKKGWVLMPTHRSMSVEFAGVEFAAASEENIKSAKGLVFILSNDRTGDEGAINRALDSNKWVVLHTDGSNTDKLLLKNLTAKLTGQEHQAATVMLKKEGDLQSETGLFEYDSNEYPGLRSIIEQK